jgi:hypothetical protein
MSIELGIVLCVLAGLFLLGLLAHVLWPAAVAVILFSIALGLFEVDYWWLLTIAGAVALVLLLFKFVPLRKAIAIAAVFIVSAGAAVGVLNADGSKRQARPVATTVPTTAAPVQNASVKCVSTWEIVQVSPNDANRWFVDGYEAIKAATTPQQAKDAAKAWVNQVKRDPELLAASASVVLHRTVDPASLYDGECISRTGAALAGEVELLVAKAEVVPAQAPTSGTNTGMTANGTVVVASQPGISGDRKAIEVRLSDGTVFWVLGRCGQLVTLTPPGFPKGPTDEKPPPTTTTTKPKTPPTTTPPTTVPPTTTTTLKPKNPNESTLVNPSIPPQVQGPGTTPVGQSPGAPQTPVDSPTGCNGPCPGSSSPPPPPPASPTMPSCGQAGQPSCGNTGVTPPTTTAPPAPPPPGGENPGPIASP